MKAISLYALERFLLGTVKFSIVRTNSQPCAYHYWKDFSFRRSRKFYVKSPALWRTRSVLVDLKTFLKIGFGLLPKILRASRIFGCPSSRAVVYRH